MGEVSFLYPLLAVIILSPFDQDSDFEDSGGHLESLLYAAMLKVFNHVGSTQTLLSLEWLTHIWTRKLKHLGPRTGLKTRDEVLEHVRKQTGQRRVLDPSELGKVVRFICMTPCITGMSINVDYGIHLGR